MRKNDFKKLFALLASACIALVGGVALKNNVVAQASGIEFAMSGASIRYISEENEGIRFGVYATETKYNAFSQDENAVVGTLIIPTDLLNGETLDINTPNAINAVTYGNVIENESNVKITAWNKNEETGYMENIVYLTGINDPVNYNRSLTAIGYIDWNGDKKNVEYTMIDGSLDFVNLSIADVAFKSQALLQPDSQDYQAKYNELDSYLNEYKVDFIDNNGEIIQTQMVKYGQKFEFPEISVPNGSTFGWYKRVGGTSTPIWSENPIDTLSENRVVKKNAQYRAELVENVTYQTTLYNSQNMRLGDPSVQYKDGWYYLIYPDSQGRIWIMKSRSMEYLLDSGTYTNDYGHTETATCIYTPQAGAMFGAEAWAPELTYIQGKWYIYVCGVPYGEEYTHDTKRFESNMHMYVLECKSQDPTGEWNAPIRLSPKGFDTHYSIDGHAFEYNNQLYYVFSGQQGTYTEIFGYVINSTGDDAAYLYLTKMNSPTEIDASVTPVKVSQGTDLEEGPCTIVDGDDVYLMYSAGAWNNTYPDNATKNYHIEYYKLENGDPMNASAWQSMGTCFEQDPEKSIYAVGHNHIFTGADGEYWTSYHANTSVYYNEDGSIYGDANLANRRVMVQPVSIKNGELDFGGVQKTVTITDKDGLQYANAERTEYLVDGKGSGRIWKNDGMSFTVSTTITRMSGSENFCAGVTLYERNEECMSRLLIGVQMDGSLFFCKDYSRSPFYYKYVGYQWSNRDAVDLRVTYIAGNSITTSILEIVISDHNGTAKRIHTYTLEQINQLICDSVDGESKAFEFAFTGDFEIGLGGNLNECKFTNVIFDLRNEEDSNWLPAWDESWNSDWRNQLNG